jgi:hypothetical protein
MPGVAFTHDAAVRIANVVRKVERTPQNLGGERGRAAPQDTSFHAYLSTPGGYNGLFWSWVRVAPVDAPPTAADPFTAEDVPLWQFADPIVSGYQNARESNNNRSIPTATVVKLEFVGYDKDGEPLYVFNYGAAQQDAGLPIHDHRDNFNGGLAFATYHPGTALPQMPWSV